LQEVANSLLAAAEASESADGDDEARRGVMAELPFIPDEVSAKLRAEESLFRAVTAFQESLYSRV
jgi:hypothetical protein